MSAFINGDDSVVIEKFSVMDWVYNLPKPRIEIISTSVDTLTMHILLKCVGNR